MAVGDIVFHKDKRIVGEFENGLWWLEGDYGSWDGPSQDWLTHRNNVLSPVKGKEVVLQAGGNLGLYPMMLASRFNRVYTFEPHPLNFRCMMRNLEDKRNVYAFNCALSNVNDRYSMTVSFEHNMGVNRVKAEGEDRHCLSLTIDQLNLDACDLIWLDVEGFEPNIIAGALQTIEKFKPVVAVETTTEELRKSLEPFGYEYKGRSISDNVYVVPI